MKICAYQIAQKIKSNKAINIFEIFELFQKSEISDFSKGNFEGREIHNSVFQSLFHISTDLYVLLKNYRDFEEFNEFLCENRKNNIWWDIKIWLRIAAKKSIFFISKDILRQEIQSSLTNLSQKMDNTSNLANECLDLSELSIALGLQEEAVECLKLSAQNILGYGWRKDTTLSEVYSAIKACSDYKVGNVSDWLKRLSPFTNNVSEFTEKEIRHIPAWYMDLLAKNSPERLVDEFEHHLKNHNWAIIPDIIKSFIKYAPLQSSSEHALLRCLTTYETLNELEIRTQNDVLLMPLYEMQNHALGGGLAPKERNYSSSDFDKKIDIAYNTYSPDQLKNLDQDLKNRNIYSAEEYIEGWINYWSEQKMGDSVINAFEAMWDEEDGCSSRFNRCLHKVFLLSKKLQGNKKAYVWAVRDIRINNYWVRWWSNSESESNLKTYAKIYKSKWKELLLDTIQGEKIKLRGNENIVVPMERLVIYLLSAEQSDLACQITESMVHGLENEVSHLPIPPLHWRDNPVKTNEIASHLLLLHFKWPDKLARLKTSHQMAYLLDTEINFRNLYLENLKKQNYEIDITDLLSVLFLTKGRIFSENELNAAIKYPSILSDHILNRLGYSSHTSKDTLYHTDLIHDQYQFSENFEKAKDGIPSIYFSMIRRLGEKLDYPLLSHLSAEWETISKRDEFFYFNPYNYCGDRFYGQDKILCSFSSHAESVLLSSIVRTLSFAYTNLQVPLKVILSLATELVPFGSEYNSLLPVNEPAYWPTLPDKFSKDDEVPTIKDLDQYLNNLLKSEEIILRASGPVSRQVEGINCDLDVSIVYVKNNADLDPKTIYKTAVQSRSNQFAYALATSDYLGDVGRWEIDWLLRGYFQPEFAIGDPQQIKLQISKDTINFMVGGIKNASWQYWTHKWYPVYHRGLGSSHGTYLKTSKEIWEIIKSNLEDNFHIIGKLTIVDKRGYNSEEEPLEIYSIKKIVT